MEKKLIKEENLIDGDMNRELFGYLILYTVGVLFHVE